MLTAFGKKTKRSLNQDDQDELMDEVQSLVSKFIRNKKMKTMPNAVTPIPTSNPPQTNQNTELNPNVNAPSTSGFGDICPMPTLVRRNNMAPHHDISFGMMNNQSHYNM